MHDVVLALALDEVHPREILIAGIAVDRGAEPVGDPSQRRGRGHRQPELLMDVTDQTGGILQPRHVDVEIHPVDALDLEDDMLGNDIGDTAR